MDFLIVSIVHGKYGEMNRMRVMLFLINSVLSVGYFFSGCFISVVWGIFSNSNFIMHAKHTSITAIKY